ncbi:MAG TPA: hypothetical protein VF042_12990 [Gemmatimonadaceae bacterium]
MKITLFALLFLAACRTSTGPRSLGEDTFGAGALSRYVNYSDQGNPWSLGNNSLDGNGIALHSVLIRKNVVLPDAFIEAVVDSVDDGGLVLRFADNEHYYLLAIRDDQAPSPRNVDNLQIYRRTGEGQAGFTSLWRKDVTWPRGVSHVVGFAVSGDTLRVFFDMNKVGELTDVVHMNGGGLGVRHYGNSASWISRYRLLRWGESSALD